MIVRETAYDEIFDSQQHFRMVLDSMARPGVISALHAVAVNPPQGLNAAAAFVAFSLLSGDVSFHIGEQAGEAARDYLAANTLARPVALEEADFLFLDGASGVAPVEAAKSGSLPYPDTGATLIVQLERLSRQPIEGGLCLTVQGPGVETTNSFFVRPLNPELLDALRERNSEFPLGLDTVLAAAEGDEGGPCVACLPRTSAVVCERC